MSKKGKGKDNLERNMGQSATGAPSFFSIFKKNKNFMEKYQFEGVQTRLDSYKEDSLVFAPIKDEVLQIGKVIACRIVKQSGNEGTSGNNEDLEYYIHFEGYNRRIDKWVKHKDIIRVRLYILSLVHL